MSLNAKPATIPTTPAPAKSFVKICPKPRISNEINTPESKKKK